MMPPPSVRLVSRDPLEHPSIEKSPGPELLESGIMTFGNKGLEL